MQVSSSYWLVRSTVVKFTVLQKKSCAQQPVVFIGSKLGCTKGSSLII